MRPTWIARAAAAAFACLLVSCGGEPPLRPLAEDAVILAFGDSLTYGTGTIRERSYPSVLQEMTGRRVINAGVPGELSTSGLQRLPGLLDEHDPQLLILIHGGNDLLRRTSRKLAADNLAAMIGEARSRDIDVVMLGVPQPGLLLDTAAFYEEVALNTNTPIDDGVLESILQYPSNKSDAVHPNAEGYRMLAEGVVELLEDSGAL